MKWMEVSVRTHKEAEDAVVNIFYELGTNGVAIEEQNLVDECKSPNAWDFFAVPASDLAEHEVLIKGYLSVDHDLHGKIEEIRAKVADLTNYGLNPGRGEIHLSAVEEEDWADSWKQYYKTQKIDKRLVIKPSWEDYSARPDELIIELDPGMAFGTGTHPTTTMCLESLERYLNGGETVFDVGTGSGILAIAAAKLGASRVKAVDIDGVAVEVARKNIIENHVEQLVRVEQGGIEALVGQSADLIIANIIADVIIMITPQVTACLQGGGIFIASGIIDERTADVKSVLAANGLVIKEIRQEKGWVLVVAEKGKIDA